MHCAKRDGITIKGAGTKGRLERCDIAENEQSGAEIAAGADPTLVACKCVKQGESLGLSHLLSPVPP